MEEGPMALSTRKRDWQKVLSEAKKGLITLKQAANQLDVTEGHVLYKQPDGVLKEDALQNRLTMCPKSFI